MAGISLIEGRAFAALLFDMDGTVLTSIAAAERIWTRWASAHGLDVAAFLPTMHGKRAVDTVRGLDLPGVDAEQEAAAISEAEMADVEGVDSIPGAIPFLSALPPERWAIVTSAPRALAEVRLAAAGIALPRLMITAEDVTRGKPHPDGYRLAADRLGYDIGDCLIFEDAPAGIAAAEASGGTVVVISATHIQPLDTPHTTIAGFDELSPSSDAAGIWIGQGPRLFEQ
ncbi:HAD-IA family hydrolase [Kaistia dalseonensis]|uniref:Sugar-phosphatase n=1 Tax=Kaistia dalseonensis TaxID=410840 RepID=A0ABU0H4J4_9HYPH|nr:HAD-IA family hydrolase [Kaistia dalseonensis]MCX5494096.1 HAD-IA family hydrolase [Kaistia dalseonensis]MDQ0436675.1 sugar-phosphatase [Kaistia dalseonensis]